MNHGFKLHPDCTLEITMPKGVKVGRVLVQEEMSQNGALYYRDGDVPKINVGDTISRQAAIDVLNSERVEEDGIHYWRVERNKNIDAAVKIIQALPSADPEWIPCSEHLPKKNGTYIVTEKVFSVDDYHHKGKYQIKVEPVDFFGGAFMRAPYFEVLAWMPLPAPYQPKEDES